MLVHQDSIYLFSKNWGNNNTKLYRLPKQAGDYVAEKICTYPINGLVTGADINNEFNEIILIGYKNEIWIPFVFLLFDYQYNDFFSGNKRRIDLPYITSAQTEGICYYKNKNVFISSEKTKVLSERLFQLNTGQWTDITSTGVPLTAKGDISFNIHPNPAQGRKFKITIPGTIDETCVLQIFDSTGKEVYVESYDFEVTDKDMKIRIKCREIGKGLHLVRLQCGAEYATRKLIID
jgi:hypothetical protein